MSFKLKANKLTVFVATFFGATREELTEAGESIEDSTELATEGRFLASLGVYHEIHCLVRYQQPQTSNERAICKR